MKLLIVVLLALTLIVVVAAIGMAFFWLGWNTFVTPMFSMPEITLWQSFCAMLIIGTIGGAFKANVTSK